MLGVVDGGLDFEAVADDACVGEQAGDVGFAKGGDGGDVELGIGSLKGGAFVEDGGPA